MTDEFKWYELFEWYVKGKYYYNNSSISIVGHLSFVYNITIFHTYKLLLQAIYSFVYVTRETAETVKRIIEKKQRSLVNVK